MSNNSFEKDVLLESFKASLLVNTGNIVGGKEPTISWYGTYAGVNACDIDYHDGTGEHCTVLNDY